MLIQSRGICENWVETCSRLHYQCWKCEFVICSLLVNWEVQPWAYVQRNFDEVFRTSWSTTGEMKVFAANKKRLMKSSVYDSLAESLCQRSWGCLASMWTLIMVMMVFQTCSSWIHDVERNFIEGFKRCAITYWEVQLICIQKLNYHELCSSIYANLCCELIAEDDDNFIGIGAFRSVHLEGFYQAVRISNVVNGNINRVFENLSGALRMHIETMATFSFHSSLSLIG